MKTYIKIIVVGIIVLLIAGMLFLLMKRTITGRIIEENDDLSFYIYTKAICNQSNFCQDNEIHCNGTKVVSVIPITGAVIQHSENWEDPRAKEAIEKLC